MLSLIKLADAEYPIAQVALGIEEYYLGHGEAPGVWAGRWSAELGLEGVVEAGQLRALVNGVGPNDGTWWLEGRPARRVNALDATFSAPKSASLLWAFGSPAVASIVSRAHVQAVAEALAFLEARAALSRQQCDGVRRQVQTHGFAVATFVHRTSRAGDPQLHSHCIVPNLVRRLDGSHASLDAAALYTWAKAAGSVYQEQLRRIITTELGVAWGQDRNGCREIEGFSPEQLRAFSKRSQEIEQYLEQHGGIYESAAARMRADHEASLATRAPKDHELTPEHLRERWAGEARAVGLHGGHVEQLVAHRAGELSPLSVDDVVQALCDTESGLCANDSRFGEAQVIERVAALGAGRLSVLEIEAISREFLSSEHVVRLSPDAAAVLRSPPQWSTSAHLALERRVLDHIAALLERRVVGIDPDSVERAVTADLLGADQAEAVRALGATGPALRSLIAPAGFGKTTAVHAAAVAAAASGRPVIGVATTNRAVAELRDVGIEAVTIARLAVELAEHPLAEGTVVVLDEASQTATADAEVVLAAVSAAPGAQLWCLGDVRQAQAVRAGGLAVELHRLGEEGQIPAPALHENRRQRHPAERAALAAWRAGDRTDSQAIRAEAGLEHELPTPTETREAMADAVVADIQAHGAKGVAALAVTHADCEDLADRIRERLEAKGAIGGPALEGPGFANGAPRRYQAGDRVLLHANLLTGGVKVPNGTALSITAVTEAGLHGTDDHGALHLVPVAFVVGTARGGRPNLSHAWCRTVDGSQGGTWDRVHLLGTGALDSFSAYVGQSRARVATQTWNVRRLPAGDWGGRLADQRSGAEEVLAAAGRAPLKTFAAHDDPFSFDRQLSEEIATHQAVLVSGPPDLSDRLAVAHRELGDLDKRIAETRSRLARAEGALAEIGPFAALRRENRQSRQRWAEVARRHQLELTTDEHAQRQLATQIGQLERAAEARRVWEAREAWRTERIESLRDQLGHHWANAVLGAARQDDPLAYGTQRLRDARAVLAADLNRLDATLPPNRSEQLAQAESTLRQLRTERASAEQLRRSAAAERADATRLRLGRRDKFAIALAEQRLHAAEGTVERLGEATTTVQATVASERAAVTARASAEAATADQRRQLTDDLQTIADALQTTRPERILAAAEGHPDGRQLRDLLGPIPMHPRARAVWLQLGVEVDTALDDPAALLARGAVRQHRTDTLVAELLDGNRAARLFARARIAGAGRSDLDRSGMASRGITRSRPSPSIPPPQPVRDQGLSLGL